MSEIIVSSYNLLSMIREVESDIQRFQWAPIVVKKDKLWFYGRKPVTGMRSLTGDFEANPKVSKILKLKRVLEMLVDDQPVTIMFEKEDNEHDRIVIKYAAI